MSEKTMSHTPGNETHIYPDGSFVVGVPPWPEHSPKQRAFFEQRARDQFAKPASPQLVTAFAVEMARWNFATVGQADT